MRNAPYTVAVLLSSSLALAQPAAASQPEQQNPESASEDLGAIAERHAAPLVDSGIVPGLVVGVLREGERSYFGFGRLSNDKPATPDGRTLFEIGSITKTFTATLLADAVARGELDLDDPITVCLPEGVDPPRWKGAAPTLGQLADHTSGMARLPMNLAALDQTDPYAGYGSDRLWENLETSGLLRAPGERYGYSNLGVGLLGTLLARHEGTPYPELVRERITGPLGMDDTAIELTEAQRARFAQPHLPGGDPVPAWTFDALAGAGALRSTAADLLTWADAQLDPGSTPLTEAIRITHEPRFNITDRPTMVALGWHIAGDADTLLHDGGTGGSRSILLVSPKHDAAVVVLANAADERVAAVGEKILQTLAGDNPEPIRIQADEIVADVPDEALARLHGAYTHPLLGRLVISPDGNRVRAKLGAQPALAVFPSSRRELFYRVIEARLEFELPDDEGGKAVAVTLHQAGRAFRFERTADDKAGDNGGDND